MKWLLWFKLEPQGGSNWSVIITIPYSDESLILVVEYDSLDATSLFTSVSKVSSKYKFKV